MGIKKLYNILNDSCLVEEKEISDFEYKIVAIDISIMLYKSIISVRNTGADLVNNTGKITSHILGLFNNTIKLISYKILPVYVFDGKPPLMKSQELKDRKKNKTTAKETLDKIKLENDKVKKLYNNKKIDKDEFNRLSGELEKSKIKYMKRNVHVDKDKYDDCKELLDLMGIPYVQAPEEADSQCAYLSKMGYVDYVYTDDMDILTFGGLKIVKNLFKKKINVINIKTIHERLNINHNQFIELCLLLGTDYNVGLLGSGKKIFKNYINTKKFDKDIIRNADDVIEYFNHPKVNETEFKFKLKPCKLIELTTFLVSKHGLIQYKIERKFKILNTAYSMLNKNCVNI